MSRSDEQLFDRARDIALSGAHDLRVRVGALLTRGTHPVAWGVNVPGQTTGEQFLAGHAERRALAGVPAIKGTLYVARVLLNDELGASWPCDECMTHIRACGCVTKICYYDGFNLVKVRL